MVQSLLSYQSTNILKHSHASQTEGLRVMFYGKVAVKVMYQFLRRINGNPINLGLQMETLRYRDEELFLPVCQWEK